MIPGGLSASILTRGTLPTLPSIVGEYIGVTHSGFASASHTFSAHSIGTASADRLVVCAYQYSDNNSSTTLNSATIGGVTASIVTQIQADSTGNDVYVNVAIFSAVVPTGTTGDIACVMSDGISASSIAVYTIKDYQSTTPTDSATAFSTSGVTSVDIDTDDGSYLIGGTCREHTDGITWAGALTEDYDTSEDDDLRSSSASAVAGTSVGISAAQEEEPRAVLAVASWR